MRGKIIEKQRDICDDTMDKKHDKKTARSYIDVRLKRKIDKLLEVPVSDNL